MPSPEGWFRAWRSLFDPDHHLGGDVACRRFAWLDLISMAAHEPCTRVFDTESVHLDRGEILASIRFLEARWRWSKDKIRRFLAALETATAIGTVKTTRVGTVYRVVNYDTYQNPRDTEISTGAGQQTGHQRDTNGTNTRIIEELQLPLVDSSKAVTMWGIWLEELGGEPPHPKLSTGRRKQSLELLYREQLRHLPDPIDAFRRICWAVQASEHHMSNRSYQLPESLFRSPERRERWTLEGRSTPPTKSRSRTPRAPSVPLRRL